MIPHPSEPGPTGEDRNASTGGPGNSSPGTPTEPLPPRGGAPAEPLPAGARPGGFLAWVRSLGIVRGPDRWLGGVSSGIAARTGLDPVLVRGLFIVLALFGVGLLLYGVAWALLPEPDGRIHAEEALHGSWTSGTTGALVACALGAGSPSIFWSGDGVMGGLFWSLFWVVGVGLLIYWLATRSGRSAPGGKPAPATPRDHHTAEPYAPEWTAPAPKPAPIPARPRTTPGGAEVALVLGAVLLVLGTVLTLDYVSLIALEEPVAVALAAAAVVNGLGLVVLGALGRSSGILGLTALAAVLSALVTGIGIGTYANVVVANEATWTPDSSRPATGGYALAAAEGQLDLRYLSDEANSSVEVPVSVAGSDLTILVPDDVPVLVHADMFAGNVQIDDGDARTESGGLWKSSDERLNDQGSEPLVVHVKGFASNVLVTVNESDLER